MSQLSKLFHKQKGEILRSLVEYLEEIELPKETKAKIVVDVMKAIHLGEGNPWTTLIEQGVLAAIDYVLGEVRGWAKSKSGGSANIPANPPTGSGGSIYGNFDTSPVPSNEELIKRGYKRGDVVWGYGATVKDGGPYYYTVAEPGAVPPLIDNFGKRIDDAPVRIIS